MKPAEKTGSSKILSVGGLSQIAIASTMLPSTLRNDPADQVIIAPTRSNQTVGSTDQPSPTEGTPAISRSDKCL